MNELDEKNTGLLIPTEGLEALIFFRPAGRMENRTPLQTEKGPGKGSPGRYGSFGLFTSPVGEEI